MKHPFFRKLLSSLPKWIRYPIYRNSLKLPHEFPEGLELKLVSNEEEFLDALRVLHDCYVKQGFMQADPSGIRATPYHFVPSTLMAIAKFNGKVVGTMSVIRDNKIGLPMDKAFDLSSLRQNGKILAEVSALAIAPEFRGSKGALFHMLIRYLWTYSKEWYGIDHYVIAVNPSMSDFYEAFYGFSPIDQRDHKLQQYDFANGAPAVALQIPVPESYEILRRHYKNKAPHKNIYDFFVNSKKSFEKYPTKKYFVMSDSFLNEETFRDLHRKISSLIDGFSTKEKNGIANSYGYTDFESLINSTNTNSYRPMRFDSRCAGTIISESYSISSFETVTITDVSRTGLRIFAPTLPTSMLGKNLLMKINPGPQVSATLKVNLIWIDEKNGTAGLKIIKLDQTWLKMFDHIAESLQMTPESHQVDSNWTRTA